MSVRLEQLLAAATPGPWAVTEPEDSWHFRLASIICLGTSDSNDLDLAALTPDMARLLIDMGEALRADEMSFETADALLARLDALGKDTA